MKICEKVVGLRYLLRTEAWGHPHVLLQGTARVVIRSGVSLEVVHELGDGLLHLQRHGCHYMLLYTKPQWTQVPLSRKQRQRSKVVF